MKRIAVLVVILSFCALVRAQDEAASLFNAYCRPCHDINGDGKTSAGQMMSIPDLRSMEVQKLSDDELFQRIGNGAKHKQYPHAFLKRGVSDAQVRQLVTYLRSLKAKN